MEIEYIPELRLTQTDETQIAALLLNAFGPDFGGRPYYRQRHHLRIVARLDGTVLGHVALLYRDIRIGDVLIPIVGLAEVCADVAHRGQGIATTLLTAAIAQAKTSNAAFMVLFGDRPIYAGLGFQQASNRLRYVVMDDAVTHDVVSRVDDGFMYLPLTDVTWDEEADIDLLGHLF